MTGGSRLNKILSDELKNIFPKALVAQSYGQTEVAGWISLFQWHKREDVLLAEKNPDSVGRLIPGFSCKVNC